MRCRSCSRTIRESEERQIEVPARKGEPACYDWACRFCAPSGDEQDRAINAHWERLQDEARDGDAD